MRCARSWGDGPSNGARVKRVAIGGSPIVASQELPMAKQRLVFFVLMLLTHAAMMKAADTSTAPDEKQYTALSEARTRAELATRRARAFFLDNDNAWKQAAQAVEAARGQIDDRLIRAIEAEQRKLDDQRNQARID